MRPISTAVAAEEPDPRPLAHAICHKRRRRGGGQRANQRSQETDHRSTTRLDINACPAVHHVRLRHLGPESCHLNLPRSRAPKAGAAHLSRSSRHLQLVAPRRCCAGIGRWWPEVAAAELPGREAAPGLGPRSLLIPLCLSHAATRSGSPDVACSSMRATWRRRSRVTTTANAARVRAAAAPKA
jgi:hypothetical protein